MLERFEQRGDETMVNADCGTGRLMAELLERLPRGRGTVVDRSENVLRAAEKCLRPR